MKEMMLLMKRLLKKQRSFLLICNLIVINEVIKRLGANANYEYKTQTEDRDRIMWPHKWETPFCLPNKKNKCTLTKFGHAYKIINWGMGFIHSKRKYNYCISISDVKNISYPIRYPSWSIKKLYSVTFNWRKKIIARCITCILQCMQTQRIVNLQYLYLVYKYEHSINY